MPKAKAWLTASISPLFKDIEPVIFGPNITGTVKPVGAAGKVGLSYDSSSVSGAFYKTSMNLQDQADGVGSSSNEFAFSFGADRSNGLYGDSNTVQPASCQLLIIIKI